MRKRSADGDRQLLFTLARRSLLGARRPHGNRILLTPLGAEHDVVQSLEGPGQDENIRLRQLRSPLLLLSPNMAGPQGFDREECASLPTHQWQGVRPVTGAQTSGALPDAADYVTVF